MFKVMKPDTLPWTPIMPVILPPSRTGTADAPTQRAVMPHIVNARLHGGRSTADSSDVVDGHQWTVGLAAATADMGFLRRRCDEWLSERRVRGAALAKSVGAPRNMSHRQRWRAAAGGENAVKHAECGGTTGEEWRRIGGAAECRTGTGSVVVAARAVGELVAADLAVEGRALDAEDRGGAALVPAGLLSVARMCRALDVVERDRLEGGSAGVAEAGFGVAGGCERARARGRRRR